MRIILPMSVCKELALMPIEEHFIFFWYREGIFHTGVFNLLFSGQKGKII